MVAGSSTHVFINCPFDDDYAPGFRALIFSVWACGFRARCAREMDDAAEPRIEKLYRIIDESRYGIHDLSRTELDKANGLPRFNMPLELGVFLGARRYGDETQKLKRCLVFDVEEHRFRKFISDISGMDITPHGGEPRQMVECTRDWLITVSRRRTIPSTAQLLDSYERFTAGLPAIAAAAGLNEKKLAFPDFERLLLAWIKTERREGRLS